VASVDELKECEAIRERDRQFTEWRQARAAAMPELAARVFALRTRGYMGCGFHYALEKSLGACLMMLNNYDPPRPGDDGYYNSRGAICNQITLKVSVEHLEKRVAAIEAELTREGCQT
jgi:hypothetical protein